MSSLKLKSGDRVFFRAYASRFMSKADITGFGTFDKYGTDGISPIIFYDEKLQFVSIENTGGKGSGFYTDEAVTLEIYNSPLYKALT